MEKERKRSEESKKKKRERIEAKKKRIRKQDLERGGKKIIGIRHKTERKIIINVK